MAGWTCPACGHAPPLIDGHAAFAPDEAEANEGFDAAFFPRLVALEESSFWFHARNRLIVWALARYFPQARTFLEVGCGTAFVLTGLRAAFPQLSLCGSEIFSAGLAEAERRLPDAELFQMDARRMPFEEEFDVVGAFDVIEHIEDDRLVLDQMRRAVTPGGGILLTVPQHPWLWSHNDDAAHHVRRYSKAELIEKVTRAGFEILRVSSFVSLLLPFMAASRFTKRKANADVTGESETVAGWVNTALARVMDVEGALVRGGVSFPAGGSLLVVAKRT
jgi:SAM-dependent methyltransferase